MSYSICSEVKYNLLNLILVTKCINFSKTTVLMMLSFNIIYHSVVLCCEPDYMKSQNIRVPASSQ